MYGQGGVHAAELVISCLANRQRKGWGSYFEVIESIPKYAAELEQPVGYPEIWSPEFVKLLHSVEGIYDGSAKDMAQEGVYWCDLRTVETPFFKDVILGQKDLHKRVVDMNSFSVFT